MKNFKKIIWLPRRWAIGLALWAIGLALWAIATTSASFSLEKGESWAAQGKFREAMEILAPLADQNNPRALYLMGIAYLSRQSNLFYPQKGVAFLEQAALRSYVPAINELAGLYLVGDGVEKNEQKALQYYIRASEMGYGPSQFNCGIMYKKGQGTKTDLVKSYVYLSLAALNNKDLEDMTLDAAKYRDELVSLLTPGQRQEALRQVNRLTLSKKQGKIRR